MKALKQANQFAKSLFKSSPIIYHIRVTKSLSSRNVPKVIDKLKTMRESKAPRIFALSLNCPSGNPVLTKTLRDALLETSNFLKAPLYTFAEDTALQSGYYLLSAGHKIYANPYSLVGDIATIVKQVKIDRILKKYVKVTLVKSGKYKNMALNLEETSPETSAFLNKLTQIFSEEVIQEILDSRGLILEKKVSKGEQIREDILDGRTFTATQALDKGLIDGITTFEEFRETYYKDCKLTEYTIDKDERIGYEQISSSVNNWWQILSESPERADSVLESYSNQQVQSQVELAEDVMRLLRSEGFMDDLREFIAQEVIGEAYGDLQGRMAMGDIAGFLDQSGVIDRSVLNGRI